MANDRLDLLQPYPFEKLRGALADCAHGGGLEHIALSIGEPKHAPPSFVIDALSNPAALTKQLATYPATRGADPLREAISQWLKGRFAVDVSPDNQILPVNGTREALFSFAQAVLSGDPKSLVGMPNPFYQIYEGAALLAGAQPFCINNTFDNEYQADFDSISPATWEAMELLYICSPGNPTGHLISDTQMRHLIELAHRYDFVIAADECYSEIYFSDQPKPSSLLASSAAMGNCDFSRCVVFHSLSKRSNLPGLRSGFVAGDPNIIERFLAYRTYHGCALGMHQQHASTLAWQDEAHVSNNRALYEKKFSAVTDILAPHYDLHQPAGGFYHWLPTPIDDVEFCQAVFSQQHITVMPGTFLGRSRSGSVDKSHDRNSDQDFNPGRNHVRVAWVAPLEECIEAAQRLVEFAKNLR
jgi:N-succinyldiaminopimelate aminotransferase